MKSGIHPGEQVSPEASWKSGYTEVTLLVTGEVSRYSLLSFLFILKLTSLILRHIPTTSHSSLGCSGSHYSEQVSAVASSGGLGGARKEEGEEGEVCICPEIIKISLIVNLTSV